MPEAWDRLLVGLVDDHTDGSPLAPGIACAATASVANSLAHAAGSADRSKRSRGPDCPNYQLTRPRIALGHAG